MRRVVAALTALPIAAMGLTACGPSDLERARDKLSGAADQVPASYVYDLNSDCGERSGLGNFRITVANGTVTDVQPLGDTEMYDMTADSFPTITDLIDIVDNAEPDAEIEVEVDSAGLPVLIDIDHIPDAIDDEECYRITNLQSKAER